METLLPSLSTELIFLSSTGVPFKDHLYTALRNAGFRTFRDRDDIEIGHAIKPQLRRAIEQSTLSIIVFTRHYGYSEWCLDELLKILERKKFDDLYTIFPIFYDVQPREVRNQIGSFQKAFEEYERNGEHSKEKIDKWRKALKEVTELRGKVLQDEGNRHEAGFIQKIVKDVGSILKRAGIGVASYTVGIESRVRDIELWLKDPSDVMVGVISGKRGIGKTTIAKVVYNSNLECFEATSFLANIREVFEHEDGIVGLQSQLLSDISKEEKHNNDDIKDGIVKVQDAICGKRILLTLDDVHNIEQVHKLIGEWHSFAKESKIIITTSRVLQLGNLPHKTFRIKQLDDYESLRLFSWHAFAKFHPIEGYLEHSERVVQHCEGVPLALQVMGSSLAGKDSKFWTSTLEKLEAIIPEEQIHRALEMSYELLQEDGDQRLFLTIASHYVGKDKDDVVEMLKKRDLYSKDGMLNLMNRSLISIGEGNKILMNSSVLEMAKRKMNTQEIMSSPGRHNLYSSTGMKTDTVTVEGSRGKRKRLEDCDDEPMSQCHDVNVTVHTVTMSPDLKNENLFKRLCLRFFSLFQPRTWCQVKF